MATRTIIGIPLSQGTRRVSPASYILGSGNTGSYSTENWLLDLTTAPEALATIDGRACLDTIAQGSGREGTFVFPVPTVTSRVADGRILYCQNDYDLPVNFRISCWLRRNGTGAGGTFLQNKSVAGSYLSNSLKASLTANTLTCLVKSAAGTTYTWTWGTTGQFEVDTWMHIKIEVDRLAGVMRAYRDGTLLTVATNPAPGLPSTITRIPFSAGSYYTALDSDNMPPLMLGSQRNGTQWRGQMADFLLEDVDNFNPTTGEILSEIASTVLNLPWEELSKSRMGTTIPAILKTGRLDMGNEITSKRFQSIDLTTKVIGTAIKAGLNLEGRASTIDTIIDLGMGRAEQDAITNNWLIWNMGTWESTTPANDDKKWAGKSVYEFQARRRFPVHAKGIDAQLSLSTNHAQDLRLSEVNLFFVDKGGVG